MAQMAQLSLFDALKAQQAKQAGMQRAYANAEPDWRAEAEAAIEALLLTQPWVCADDFRRVVPREPDHPNRWGGLTGALIKRGWLIPTGREVVSKQAKGNGNKVELFKSGLFGHVAEVSA